VSGITLQALLDELAREDGDLAAFLQDPDASTSEALDALTALETEALDAFDDLYIKTDKADDDIAALEALTSVVEAIRSEKDRREQIATEQQAHIDELASRLRPKDSTPQSDEDAGDEPEKGEDGDQGDTDQDTAAQADNPQDGADGNGEPAGEVAVPDTPAELVEGEVVLAAGETVAPGPAKPGRASLRATRRVDLSAIARRVSRPEPPAEDAGPLGQVLVAAADVPGIATGAPFRSWHDVAEATIRRFAAMPRGDRPGAPSKRMTYGLAQIVKPDTGLNLQRYNSELELIDHAANEARLTGGSLVAAGGWCGPAERWTDLCPELDSMDGLFDLPEVTVTRGVVQYLQSPDYCAMWDMVTDGFFGPMTSEQVDAGEEKPCVEIPCPDEWLECSQEAYGLCITAGILTNKSYPEWVSRFLRFALRAHARRMSAVKLKAVYDGSDDLGMPELGAGATASVLNAIELEVEWVRYRNRLARNASLEMVAPYWIRPAIRADLANREGLDVFAVTDQQITAWFSRRGVRVQWVYDWQPLAGCDQPSPDGLPGPATPITAYPERVEFLLYPAGTWVAAAQDIITIDTLYDSTLMRRNRYTALFTEEALCVVQRCTGSYRFSVPVCPNGAIGQRVEVPCATGTSPSES